MTDNEIIKALECCSTYKGKCTDCPAFVKVDRSNCKQVLLGAIEIINRQKAEIDELRAINESRKEDIPFLFAEAIKLFAERLKEKGVADEETGEGLVYVEDIDNLVKEMVGEE